MTATEIFVTIGSQPIKAVLAGDGHYALTVSARQMHSTSLPSVVGGTRLELQADNRGRLITTEGTTRWFTGQGTAPTGTATALASAAETTAVTIYADDNNTEVILVGPDGITLTTGFKLYPGRAHTVPIDNLAKVFVLAANAGQHLCYSAIGNPT